MPLRALGRLSQTLECAVHGWLTFAAKVQIGRVPAPCRLWTRLMTVGVEKQRSQGAEVEWLTMGADPYTIFNNVGRFGQRCFKINRKYLYKIMS